MLKVIVFQGQSYCVREDRLVKGRRSRATTGPEDTREELQFGLVALNTQNGMVGLYQVKLHETERRWE